MSTTTTTTNKYTTPLLSTYGNAARSLLWSGHVYKSSAIAKQARPLPGVSHISISSGVETRPDTNHTDNSQRPVGVVKQNLVAATGLEALASNGVSGELVIDTQGAVSGDVFVPRGTFISGVSMSGGMNVEEHDSWQPAEMVRYATTSYANSLLAGSLYFSQTVPSYARNWKQKLPTSAVSPTYLTSALSFTLPRTAAQLEYPTSSVNVGAQVKLPLYDSTLSLLHYDVGAQYVREDEASLSCVTTNNMSGYRASYHVPIYHRGYLRGVAASFDVTPANQKAIHAFPFVNLRERNMEYNRNLSIGADLAYRTDITGKVRIDSDATLAHAWKYAVTHKASVGISQMVDLKTIKPLAFGVQLEVEA